MNNGTFDSLPNMSGQFLFNLLSFKIGSFLPMWLHDSIYDELLKGRIENIVDSDQLKKI